MAAVGATIPIAGVDSSVAAALAGEISGRSWTVDLSGTGALENLQLDADILVNSSGIQHVSPIEELDLDHFRLMLRIVLEAPFLLIRGRYAGRSNSPL